MASAQQILDRCRAMNSAELKNYGYSAYVNVEEYVARTISSHQQADAAILDCLLVCAALDSDLMRGEWEFIKYIFDFSESDYSMINSRAMSLRTIRVKRDVSDFCHTLPYNQKVSFITLCIALMCSDGRFTYEDLDFLEDCLLS